MSDIEARARQRFDGLREKAMADSRFSPEDFGEPGGWCISAIARLAENAAELLDDVAAVQTSAQAVGPLYLYPPQSLHISLLGCTPREPERQDPRSDRATAMRDAAARVVSQFEPVPVRFGRVNATGVQLFIETYTSEPSWASMRKALEEEVRALGEDPLAYADPEPMHLNLARMRDQPDAARLQSLLADPSAGLYATAVLDRLDVVVTDFVVSPQGAEVVDTVRLRARN